MPPINITRSEWARRTRSASTNADFIVVASRINCPILGRRLSASASVKCFGMVHTGP